MQAETLHTNSDSLPREGLDTPWTSSGAEPTAPTRELPQTADCVIVGAGFTGLACAHRLATLRPEWSIVVLDAMRVGDGASGRNSGFVMDVGHWHGGWDIETSKAVVALARHGVERLQRLVFRHEIACEWHSGSRYHVAVNRRGERALASFVEGMASLGYEFESVPMEEFGRRIGSSYYSRAFETAGGALVNPASLVRGIALALPDNVALVENSPVTQVRSGLTPKVYVGEALVEADNLVLATNGYMGGLGVGDSRVLPFETYASVTEPLEEPPGTEAQWGLVPEERMGATVRLTADRRILIRNGVALRTPPQVDPEAVRKAAAGHRASFERRFPQLRDVAFSHSWGGVLGVSNNGGTVFGSFGEHAWVAGAHNGVGMAQGTAMGDLLAYRICGQNHPLLVDVARLPEPSWVPPQPILGLGVRMYTGLLAALAGSER